MHFKTTHWKKSNTALFTLFFCLLFTTLSAQFSLSLNRETADFALSETATVDILSSQSGTADFKFYYDKNFSTIQTGTVDVSANTPAQISFTTENSGVIFCEVSLNEITQSTVLVFGRNEIKVQNEEPTDFDAFWESQIQLARNIPLDPQITLLSTEEEITNYRINIANLDGRRTYGYISVPNVGDDFPAFISLPAFGDGAGQVSPTSFLASRCNAITIALSIHNAEPDETDTNAYEPNNSANREEYYYRYAILGTLRMIDYLFEREDFDGENLGLAGVSQGGGLSLMVAGLEERVKLLAISNPALCHHAGYEYERESGFPDYLLRSAELQSPTDYAQTLAASAYYDASFFAKRYTGPTFANISYLDEVTPAETSFTAINNLRGGVILAHSMRLGHTHPETYWNGRLDFFRRNFQNAQRPPFFTTTGYWGEATGEEEVNLGEETVLNSRIFKEEELLDLPCQWTKISGAGNVNFSAAQSSVTSVSFTLPGTYILKCERIDTENISASNSFITVANYLTVRVLDENGEVVEEPEEGEEEEEGNGEIEASEPSGFRLFPNPTQRELQIDLQKYAGKKALIGLHGMTGQMIMQYPFEELPADILQLNLPYLPEGNYTIMAQVEGARVRLQSFLVLGE